MGAWGDGIFQNDTAAEVVEELETERGFSWLEERLDDVLEEPEEYLDAAFGEEALVLAELVAAACGHPTGEVGAGQVAASWATDQASSPSEGLVRLAQLVVERVRSPGSELFELWHEEGDDGGAGWERAVTDLSKRLALGHEQPDRDA